MASLWMHLGIVADALDLMPSEGPRGTQAPVGPGSGLEKQSYFSSLSFAP